MTFSIKKEKMNFGFDINYPEIALQSGFHLHQFRDGEMDWRFIGSVDVDQLVRDQNVEQLDGVLLHLAEAPLAATLDTNILDSSIAKYFILSQYAVQYLLFCRSFLDETVVELRTVYAESERIVAILRKSLSEANTEILKLHKKISEIEAIREVVYPCHLCSKSFVNNEALNLHINNKHNANKLANKTNQFRSDQKQSSISPQSNSTGQRIKDYDLSLINRIKLELEIKQLKERINQEGKEIRQGRKFSALSENSEREPLTKTKITDIGIQCNLTEIKEAPKSISLQSEQEMELQSTSSFNSKLREDHENVALLQEKVKNFEDWRQEQKKLYEQTIAEINDKFEHITTALDYVKTLKTQKPAIETQVERLETSHALKDMEQQLFDKIEQMAKLSREKIDQDLDDLKSNYNKKLKLFDLEIKNRRAFVREEEKFTQITESFSKELSRIEPQESKLDENTFSLSNEESHNLNLNVKTSNTSPVEVAFSNIKTIGSNRTILKSQSFIENKPKRTFKNDKFENTDISKSSSSLASNSEVENNSTKSDTSSSLALKPEPIIKESKKSKIKQKHDNQTFQNIPDDNKKITHIKKPTIKARNCVNRILNRRLAEFGCAKGQKYLSFGKQKNILERINNASIDSKQRYSQYYVTRNRIKKYVEELCNERKEVDVEKVLSSSCPIKPPRESKTKLRKPFKGASISKSELLNQSPVLNSPIQQAVDSNTLKPMPLPRKRVMFNTKDLNTLEPRKV